MHYMVCVYQKVSAVHACVQQVITEYMYSLLWGQINILPMRTWAKEEKLSPGKNFCMGENLFLHWPVHAMVAGTYGLLLLSMQRNFSGVSIYHCKEALVLC